MATNLAKVLADFSGNSFISFDATTNVTLKGGKSNPMKGRVIKITFGNLVQIFQNKNEPAYAAMVRRRLIAEGKDPNDYEPKPLPWGERLANKPIIVHTKDDVTKHYLQAIFLEGGKSTYFLDGVEIEKDKIQGLEPTAPRDDAQGGLEHMVVLRSFALDSIDTIRYKGQSFTGPFYYDEDEE